MMNRHPTLGFYNWRPSRGEALAILGLLGGILALLFLFYFLPIPHAISLSRVTFPEGTGYELNLPTGSLVQGSWSTVHGLQAHLWIQDAQGHPLYSSYSASGSFAFTASHPPYYLYATGDDIRVSGTYYSPVL